jgi:hypothetical protein
MRPWRLVPAALLLWASGPSAQGWIEYASRADFFSVNFPGQPQVQNITYLSEYGANYPARVYSYTEGPSRYSVTVVDYTDAERIYSARPKAERGMMDWQVDVQASIAYAAWKFRQRDAKVTYDAWHFVDLVAGHQLQLTNADQSRTFAGIYLHESRLYILEATVPPRSPPPGLFQQSLSFLDKDGKTIRYDSIYFNRLPPSRK